MRKFRFTKARKRALNKARKKWMRMSRKERKQAIYSSRRRKHKRRTYKGYKSRRSFIMDRKIKAKHRPAKRYRKGIGNRGDW